ncbi:MAG: hypothetical protein HZC51_09810 [Nitrospirae bacterium]|nr:hypothetical protein [Nitrospirota bacterium]
MSEDSIGITYSLTFDDGRTKEFAVYMDPDTLDLIPSRDAAPPDWAELEFRKCPNCPLDTEVHRFCPVAVNMEELIEFLKDLMSHDEVEVTVTTRERRYMRRTSLQSVGSSLMGIIMVTSGCPVLNKLRPMVETHLPFSTWEETVYRVVSMYLFGQFFKHKNGVPADWDLNGLVEIFDGIETVNQSFCRRLDYIRTQDACVNAVNILSAMGSMTKMVVTDKDLSHWENIFMEHFG